jgi:TetR/AcrR family transcriptional regulator, transcriptional repressor for nem operon
MSTKAEQKERTHETILASAGRLLRAKGIAGARVADVMSGAGLTVGRFYAHFGSKDALVDDVLRLTATRLRERLLAGLEAKDAADRAEVVLKRYLSAAHRDDFENGCEERRRRDDESVCD